MESFHIQLLCQHIEGYPVVKSCHLLAQIRCLAKSTIQIFLFFLRVPLCIFVANFLVILKAERGQPGNNPVKHLKKNFREAVEDYIEACEEMGKEPQKPFKGKILARIGPELHKQAALIALQNRVSLNKFVESAIKHEIELNL